MTDLKHVFKAPLENVFGGFFYMKQRPIQSALDTFDPDIFSSNPWDRLRLWFQTELKVILFLFL